MKIAIKYMLTFLILWMSHGLVWAYQQPVDTVVMPSKYTFIQSDTLVNLNNALGGVSEIEIAGEVEIPKGIIITKEGAIVAGAGSEFDKKAYWFELKATGGAKDVYIVNVKLDFQGELPIIVVNSDKIDMATGLRKDGMIWVVVAVSMILFGVILIYLFVLDKKVSKLS